MKKILLPLGLLGLLIPAAYLLFKPVVISPAQVSDSADFSKPVAAPQVSALIAALRADFLSSINKITTHIKMLSYREHIYKLAGKAGPGEWQRILQEAFPEQAELILQHQAMWDTYQSWLSLQNQLLAGMDPLSRQGMIWNKRQEVFGDAAKELWADEIARYEQQRLDLQNTLTELNTNPDLSLDMRLQTLNNQFALAAETSQMPAAAYRSTLASVYFGLDTVQADLKGLSAEQRQQTIHNLRKNMGYDEAQLNQLDALDAEREKRWQVGAQYSAEKKRLTAQYQGTELESKLQALREQYFKIEAKTIAMEEADGFNRFERPRYYGRN